MKKVLLLTLLAFAVATAAGCGKKAPPRAPDAPTGAATETTGPMTY